MPTSLFNTEVQIKLHYGENNSQTLDHTLTLGPGAPAYLVIKLFLSDFAKENKLPTVGSVLHPGPRYEPSFERDGKLYIAKSYATGLSGQRLYVYECIGSA